MFPAPVYICTYFVWNILHSLHPDGSPLSAPSPLTRFPFLSSHCLSTPLPCSSSSSLLFRGYSLLVMRIPSLTSLGLRSLRRINDGGVYITGNKKLCYHHTVNWTRLFSSSSRPQRRQKNIDVKENRLQSQCGETGDWGERLGEIWKSLSEYGG